jgi:hypothetical protein
MAISLSALPVIYPVYNNNLILDVSHTGATSNHYYRFDVYMGTGLTDSFNYPANPLDYHATINLSTVLSTYFETDVYSVVGITMFEEVPDSVVEYHVNVSLYSSGDTFVESGTTPTRYTYNGCTNMEESFTMMDYFMKITSSGYFLTDWHNDRQITINDYLYLQVLGGDYGSGYTSNFSGVTITRYQTDGSTSTITKTYTGTTNCIVNIDISPVSINSNNPAFITTDTQYYTVAEKNGYSLTTLRVDLIKEYKLTKFYNFSYVNRLGGIDCFTAVKVSNDEYKIKKEQLEQFVTKKTYYTNAARTTTVLTQFLSAYQAAKLKDLFVSPAVKLWFNGKMNDIRITNGSIVVLDRYPKDKFIQYQIEFEYNYKNFIQQF